MDIQLPVMDGYEAARRIKAIPELRATPIIAVTPMLFPETKPRRETPAATAMSRNPSARACSWQKSKNS